MPPIHHPIESSNLSAAGNQSRRSFLLKAGAGLGMAALYSSLPFAPLAAAQGKGGKKLGVALVGLGNYAMGELAPALQKTEHCYLAALVTGTPEKAKRYGRQYNIPDTHIYNYETYEQMADNPDIDIVYVVLPNSMHAEYTIRAAKIGKHVICEKPMAVSVEESRQMIEACEANNVTLNVGYRLHYDPHHQAIMDLARTQPHGPAKFVQSEFSFKTNNPNQWRLKRALAGGGALMDVGIYCIQAARYSTGEEPIALTAQEYKTDPVLFAEVDETITWQMEFPSGAASSSNTSYNYRAERLHVAYAEDNFNAELSPAYVYRGLQGRIGSEPLDIGDPSQQGLHMDAVAHAIKTGGDTTTSGQEGLKDMLVIEAIYQSIANGGARTPIAKA